MDLKDDNKDKQEQSNLNDPKIIKFSKERKKPAIMKILCSIVLILVIVLTCWTEGRNLMINLVQQNINELRSSDSGNVASDALKKIAPTLVTVSDKEEKLMTKQLESGNLTGVIIREDGIIITSYHIIKDYPEIFVRLSAVGSKPMKASVILSNEDLDIAVLKIPMQNLQAASFAKVDGIKEGNTVFAVGNASVDEYVGIVTKGIINSTNEMIKNISDDTNYKLIQTDARFVEQNYGGVVINTKGEILGTCSKYLSEKYNDGFYYGVSCEGVIESSKKYFDKMDKLGLDGNGIKKDGENGFEGVYINSITPDSIADRSGIKPTDIILKVNGKSVSNIFEVYNKIVEDASTGNIIFTMLRDGVETEKNINI